MDVVNTGLCRLIKDVPPNTMVCVGWCWKPGLVFTLSNNEIDFPKYELRLHALSHPGTDVLMCLEIKALDCSVVRTGQRLFTANPLHVVSKVDGTAWMLNIDKWNGLVSKPSTPISVTELSIFKVQELVGDEPFNKVVRQFLRKLKKG